MEQPAAWCDVRRHFCRCDDRCEDVVEDRDPITGMTEDQRLDDPRHGQAEELNRRYGR